MCQEVSQGVRNSNIWQIKKDNCTRYLDKTEAINYVFKDVFGVNNPFTLEEIERRFCYDIPLPVPVQSASSGEETWIYPLENKNVLSTKDQNQLGKTHDWVFPKQPIHSMKDLFKYWDKVNYHTGEKITNSTDILKSDSITNSTNIYRGNFIFNSQNIAFGYNNFDCSYLVASRGNNSCSLGIRLKESIYSSSTFEVNYSNKITRSMFIYNSFNLFECMFCFNMASKQYCIANMQYEKDEYFVIKKMVINWILKNYSSSSISK